MSKLLDHFEAWVAGIVRAARRFESSSSFPSICLCIGLLSGWGLIANSAAIPASLPQDPMSLRKGEVLARIHCVRCHLFPEPELLDKTTWREQTLPSMSYMLGIQKPELAARPGGKLIEDAGVFPKVPVLSDSEWLLIAGYYIFKSPANPLPQDSKPALNPRLDRFQVVRPEYHQSVPLTTLVKIIPGRDRFFVSDSRARRLYLLDGQGRVANSLPLPSAAVGVMPRPEGLLVNLIGSVGPNDEPLGALLRIPLGTEDRGGPAVLLKELSRPTDIQQADLNGDGRLDFLVCGFGNLVGRLSWFENLGEDRFKEHVIVSRPGSIQSKIRDFDGDGLPDLLVLMAQAKEGLFLFQNKGQGRFEEHPLLQFPPIHGLTHLELADINQDSHPDVILSNGDNGEYPSPLKRYHGVRIYLNDGKGRFGESYFYPLHGAFKTVARDFDRDGDLDLASISFFPDFVGAPGEGFVYLENKGRMNFEPATLPEAGLGRWLTMDAADLDGDGYDEIVVGAFNEGTSPVPQALLGKWKAEGLSVLILRNRGVAPARQN